MPREDGLGGAGNGMGSSGLEGALEGIQLTDGEGGSPDTSGSAAPEGQPPPGQPVGDDKEGAPAAPEGAAPEGAPEGDAAPKPEADSIEAIRQAAQPQEGDSSVIKGLRELLKQRVDAHDAQGADGSQQPDATPQLDERERQRLELVNSLYDFDREKMVPTTRGFIEKLASENVDLVGQLLWDAMNVPRPNAEAEGWTLGHDLMLRMGLDPMKYNDLVKFSKGEISGDAYGIGEIPAHIPEEYREAYQQLNPILRTDVDIYMKSEKEHEKAAGLQLLQDKQGRLNDQRTMQQTKAQQIQTVNAEISTEVGQQLSTVYTGLLDAVNGSPAFAAIRVSSDPGTDAMIKSTIVNGLCALGDDNAVLAQRAVQSFKGMGVEIDQAKISSLLKDIEVDTEIAIKAEKVGRATGKDYTTQAREALARRSDNVARAIALANKYASQALEKFTPVKAGAEKQEPQSVSDPKINGGAAVPQDVTPRRAGVLTPAELDAQIMSTAKVIREGAAT